LASVVYELFRELAFLLCFLSCVFGFRIRLLFIFCVALGSELLGLGFHAGSDSVAVWVRLGMTWVMPMRTIIYYLPKTFKTLLMGNADWVVLLGREAGDSLFASWRKTPFRDSLCMRF
jgi:hypothetical protein